MLKNLNQIKTGYTHVGTFHCDDVFAAALLRMINPNIEIVRTNEAPDDTDNIIVFDIGYGEYDHHQPNKAVRPIEDGLYMDKTTGRLTQIPYCSFGLLWRDYGRLLCPVRKAWKKVDRDLVMPTDRADNGAGISTLSNAIAQLNPAWNRRESEDEKFQFAMGIAESILWNYIQRANAETEAETVVLESPVVDGNILILEQYVPWQTTVVEQMPEILFVVHPSNRGGYAVQTVPAALGSFEKRKLFPEEWLGHPDESLGMTFCHTGNFTLSCKTQGQAIHVARIAAERKSA